MYLFREANEYGKISNICMSSSGGKKYLFMDISELVNAIITNFKDTYGCSKIEGIEMRNKYIDDYIFLGMLLGNDFMPKTHWFSIGEGGYERLLSAYWQIHNHTEKFLVDVRGMLINTEMLCDLIYIVKEQEQEAVLSLFAKRRKSKIWIKDDMNEKERQQMLVDFYPLQHLYIEQAIEPQKDGWRDRYYKICLHMENRIENRRMISQSYIKTLIWNFHYYFDECISWDWVYNFDYSPTWNDIYEELVLHKNINITHSGNNKLFHFTKSTPVDSQTLLFMVLPWASRRFMANDIVRKLSSENCPMRIYFPKKYSLNVAFHRYYYECTPIIYKMENGKVKKFIKECKLTEDELKRNLVGKLFICL
jgi:5'-3' exonuclease